MAENKSSNTDTIVKIILVFFISLLSFSIGTFVGKKFSDNQHKLSTMEPSKNEEKTAAIAGIAEHGTQEDALSDDQVAALANEFVDDEAQPASKSEHAEAATTHEETPNLATTKAETPSHKVVETKTEVPPRKVVETKAETKTEAMTHSAPTTTIPAHEKAVEHEGHHAAAPEKATDRAALSNTNDEEETKHEEPTRIPSNVAKEKAAMSNTKFTIQIASYPSEVEAQKKADELKKLNFEAFYIPATIKGQTWYRVNVGSYVSAKEALEHKAELVEKTHISSVIIQKLAQ